MKVKVEIPLLVARDGGGNLVYGAGRLSHESLKVGEAATEEWLDGEIEGPMENVHRYIITAEVDLPELPAVQEVQGEAREVGQ